MATAQDFSDLTKCSICLEAFNIPVYLPCLHTFCRNCISSYFSKNKERLCPICRKEFCLQEDLGDLESTLPVHHFMVSLMDKMKVKNDSKKCDACLVRNESKTALSFCVDCSEALCKSCEEYHKSFKVLQGHEIVEISGLESSKIGINFTVCTEHKNEAMKIYCKDHDVPCCTICATVNHRKCERVVTLEDAAVDVRKSKDVRDISSDLKWLLREMRLKVTERQENVRDLKKSASDMEMEIKQISKKIRDNVEQMEAAHLEELACIVQNEEEKQNVVVETFKGLQSAIDNCQKVLEASVTHGTDVQCFLEVNKIKSEVSSLMQDVASSTTKVQPAQILLQWCDEVSRLPQLDSMCTFSKQAGIDLANGNISTVHAFSTVSQNVFGTVTEQFVILGGFDSNKLLLIHVLDLEEFGKEINLPSSDPYDVVETCGNTVAVSFRSGSIAFIDIKRNKILKTIKTRGRVSGLAMASSKLYVNCDNSISVMDLQSTSMTDISDFNDGSDHAQYIHVTQSGNIVYPRSHDIVCKKLSNHELLFTYASDKLGNPGGIDSDLVGNIYIVGTTFQNIHQLTSRGAQVRIIDAQELGVYGPNMPMLVRFKPNSNKFLITTARNDLGWQTSNRSKKSLKRNQRAWQMCVE